MAVGWLSPNMRRLICYKMNQFNKEERCFPNQNLYNLRREQNRLKHAYERLAQKEHLSPIEKSNLNRLKKEIKDLREPFNYNR